MTFDPSRHQLGSLCAKGHEYEATGKSLRYLKPTNCVVCAINYRKDRDRRLRKEREALAPKHPPGMKACPGGCGDLISQASWRCSPCRKSYHQQRRASDPERLNRDKASRALCLTKRWHVASWRGTVSSAKRRNLPHAITPENILALWEAQSGRCYWTGVPLRISSLNRDPLRPSVDRLDPLGGYVASNIVLSCLIINVGRGNSSVADTKAAISDIRAALLKDPHEAP